MLKLTDFRDVHKFDSNFWLIFCMFSKDDPAKPALAELSYYLIVIQYGAEVEVLSYITQAIIISTGIPFMAR